MKPIIEEGFDPVTYHPGALPKSKKIAELKPYPWEMFF
jgi:hypothetical protein